MKKEAARFEDIGELLESHSFLRKLFVNDDRMHFHKAIEIGHCVSGCGKAEVDGHVQQFSKGDYIISFPFQHHYNVADEDSKEECLIRWVFVDPITLSGKLGNKSRILTAIIEEISIFGVISKNDTEAHKTVAELFTTISTPTQKYHKERLYSTLCLCLVRLSELSSSQEDTWIKLPRKFHTISRALDYLNENIEKGNIPSVEQLASATGMPLSTFRRLFGVVMATSPKKYIVDCAIKYSCFLLLTTEKSIGDIADTCGFYEISTFGRAFRAVVGISPKKFRILEGVSDK